MNDHFGLALKSVTLDADLDCGEKIGVYFPRSRVSASFSPSSNSIFC